jgi:hypothetical protein
MISSMERFLIENLTLSTLVDTQNSPHLLELPSSFANHSQYRGSFEPLLHQESLASLKSQIKHLGNPFDFETEAYDGLETEILATSSSTTIRDYDVLVLSQSETFPDGRGRFMIGICHDVQRPGPNEHLSALYVRFKLADSTKEAQAAGKWKAFSVGNIITFDRVSKAIHAKEVPRMMSTILNPAHLPQAASKQLSRNSASHELSLGLNMSQRAALRGVLSFDKCGISIIHGPPGILA